MSASPRQSNARIQPTTQKITNCLWFDKNAEEAVNFYVSVFKDAKVLQTVPYGDTGPGKKGSVMTVDFELGGQRFMALNGGPNFKFTEANSLMVNCDTQEELDYYWEKLSEGGQKVECGWLKDKFGLSWQIIPRILPELFSTPEQADRVMAEVVKMKKLDIATMKRAAEGK
ncbi:MAG TPA: VOC family protein [Pyrinomonadaceae bacterium]|nr:VOC family protein [Pyrinomonadaceae bacterium]